MLHGVYVGKERISPSHLLLPAPVLVLATFFWFCEEHGGIMCVKLLAPELFF